MILNLNRNSMKVNAFYSHNKSKASVKMHGIINATNIYIEPEFNNLKIDFCLNELISPLQSNDKFYSIEKMF
jgi:hypothetical protein